MIVRPDIRDATHNAWVWRLRELDRSRECTKRGELAPRVRGVLQGPRGVNALMPSFGGACWAWFPAHVPSFSTNAGAAVGGTRSVGWVSLFTIVRASSGIGLAGPWGLVDPLEGDDATAEAQALPVDRSSPVACIDARCDRAA